MNLMTIAAEAEAAKDVTYASLPLEALIRLIRDNDRKAVDELAARRKPCVYKGMRVTVSQKVSYLRQTALAKEITDGDQYVLDQAEALTLDKILRFGKRGQRRGAKGPDTRRYLDAWLRRMERIRAENPGLSEPELETDRGERVRGVPGTALFLVLS